MISNQKINTVKPKQHRILKANYYIKRLLKKLRKRLVRRWQGMPFIRHHAVKVNSNLKNKLHTSPKRREGRVVSTTKDDSLSRLKSFKVCSRFSGPNINQDLNTQKAIPLLKRSADARLNLTMLFTISSLISRLPVLMQAYCYHSEESIQKPRTKPTTTINRVHSAYTPEYQHNLIFHTNPGQTALPNPDRATSPLFEKKDPIPIPIPINDPFEKCSKPVESKSNSHLPFSPTTNVIKALRRAVKKENISQLKKLLEDPSLSYITYNRAFVSSLKKAINKNSGAMVSLLLEAIKKRYKKDSSPEATAVINKVLPKAPQTVSSEIVKALFQARNHLPVDRRYNLQVLQKAIDWERSDIVKIMVAAIRMGDPEFPVEKLVIMTQNSEIKNQLLPLLAGKKLSSLTETDPFLPVDKQLFQDTVSSTSEALVPQRSHHSKAIKLKQKSLNKLIQELALVSDLAGDSSSPESGSETEASVSSLTASSLSPRVRNTH